MNKYTIGDLVTWPCIGEEDEYVGMIGVVIGVTIKNNAVLYKVDWGIMIGHDLYEEDIAAAQ